MKIIDYTRLIDKQQNQIKMLTSRLQTFREATRDVISGGMGKIKSPGRTEQKDLQATNEQLI